MCPPMYSYHTRDQTCNTIRTRDSAHTNAKQLDEKLCGTAARTTEGVFCQSQFEKISNLWRHQNRYLRGYKNVLPTFLLEYFQWRMQDFLKFLFSCNIAREACAEFLRPRPFLIKTTPVFERFGEKLHVLPVNPAVFDRDFC